MHTIPVLRLLSSYIAAVGLLFAATETATASDVIRVATAAELERAVATANRSGGNVTILLAEGTYTLDGTLDIEVPHVTLAGQRGARERTVIQGDAMSATARVGNVIRVAGSYFELHDLTLQLSRDHLIQIAGETGAEAPIIHDCTLRDAYEQMLKISVNPARPAVTSNDGLVAHCTFEYSTGTGPQYYIGGIDAHGAKRWTVRDNYFNGILSPSQKVAEFAVHFWDGSSDNLVERNQIINCDRGIGFGLGHYPNVGGVIRNNMIYHAAHAGDFGDVGIALISSPGTQVYNNTIFFDDSYPRAIEYRFPSTHDVLVQNNLTNRPIVSLNRATGVVSSNEVHAIRSWFVNTSSGDLHLAAHAPEELHAGQPIRDLTDDFDRKPRATGSLPDIGAD